MNESKWVTLKDGRRILIKATNNYMNNKIRNEYKLKKNIDDYAGVFYDKEVNENWEYDENTKQFKKKKEEKGAYYQKNIGEKIEQMSSKEYNKMKSDFYNSLDEEDKKALGQYIDGPSWVRYNDADKKIDKIFETKGIELEHDTLLYRRSWEDYQQLKDGYTREERYTSTSAYDKIPKHLPSGNDFGDKELYIIAPKGTKVLPLEDVAVKYVAYDEGEKKIFARQHELLLPKNASFELISDQTTYENKGFGDFTKQEKYVVKLSNNKYNKPEYTINDNYFGLNDYVIQRKGEKLEIREKRRRDVGRGKLKRKDFMQYEVPYLAFKGEPSVFDTFEEAKEAINKYFEK